ncbi:Uncharacterised protein [uncultured archaeon]|nr:Uncharacterised protein [uncultured archaeon]
MTWTIDWKPITDLEDVPDKPGLYKIRIIRNGNPYPTQRILKEDDKGVIYIGSDDYNIKARLKNFLNALDKGKNHIAGDRLHDWREDRKINFENSDIQYIYKTTLNHNSKDEERKELINYESDYGQFPSLNRKLPKTSLRYGKK